MNKNILKEDIEFIFKSEKKNYDIEIEQLLNEVVITPQQSYEDIQKNNELNIDNIFTHFSNYEKNTNRNKILRLKEFVKDCEIVTFDKIQRGDIITCFNLKKFYDLKLINKIKITNVLKHNNTIRGITSNNNEIRVKFKKKNIYFREFDEEKLLKLNIMKLLN